jgi:7-alpha-hydroxysteroid dehydrogenase
MRRLGDVDDIALAALYLASPAAKWVTGKILEVDGGMEATSMPV